MIPAEITSPLAGGKMLASWGADVSRAVNAHGAELQDLRRPGKWGSERAESWAAPVPFEVRRLWVSESGGSGKVAKWCIYLPSNSLYVAQAAVDATDGLTAAGGAPAGWYELPEFPGEDGSGSAYLHVTLPDDESEEVSDEETENEGDDESHEAEAEIVAEVGEQGERDFYIEIAAIASDGKVLQKVVGTLVVDKDWKTGVTSLNELDGGITIEGGHKIDVTTEGQTILIDYNPDKPDPFDDDYCNAISGDGEGDGGGGDGGGMGWLDGFGDGGGGDGIQGSNEISKWPCDSGAEGEAA
jgi:hypothetical protein